MQLTRLRVLAVAAALALALSGCQPGSLESEESSQSPTPEDPNPTDTYPVPSTPPTTDPVGGASDFACDQLLTLQQVYDFNINFAATATPASGIPQRMQAMIDAGGIVCAWQHVTGTDVLLVAVAPGAGDISESTDGGLTFSGAYAGDSTVLVASQYFDGDAELMATIIGAVVENINQLM